jgi:hypothetical protein
MIAPVPMPGPLGGVGDEVGGYAFALCAGGGDE